MADAYRVKADVSLPRAIREVEELVDGTKVYETVGVNYAEGQYVLAEEINPRDRERAENGELDHLLEPVDRDEAEKARALDSSQAQYQTFIAEHEAEAVVLREYGHEVVPREQVLELRSQGAEEAREALELAKEEGLDERPGLRGHDAPPLPEVEKGEARNVPESTDSDPVDEEKTEGLEQPPGVNTGPTKRAAERHPDVARQAEVEENKSKRSGSRKSAAKKADEKAAVSEEKSEQDKS